MSEPTSAAQLKLKNEGNELFKKQDYVGAIIKYTEAIALDDKNAVLYANRAACNYALSKYLDAVDDAHLATEIDPSYAKGWSRLAASRDVLSPSTYIGACGLGAKRPCLAKGAGCAPKDEFQPLRADNKKHNIPTNLKAANARSKQPIVPFTMNENMGKFPWQIATEMLPELRKAGTAKASSSAWVIALAYEEFNNGVEAMKGMKIILQTETPGTFGLTALSNGFMRDDRVFHINQPNWIDMYNQQVHFEVTARKAWNSEGLETIKELAQKRLKENGWDDVRPALAVTVRAWIMRAAFEGGLKQESHAGVEYYRRALDLVEWGRTVWKDVPKASRGAIFEHSFLIGIRSLYLKMFMNAYTDDPGLNSKFPLEQLKEEAEDLLKETEIALRTRGDEPVDPGFISSFIVYPDGLAHAMLGFYHVQSAQYNTDPIQRMFNAVKAAGEYTRASSKYAEDDELRAWYLNCALDCMRNAGVPIENFLMAATGLQDAFPRMQKIWAVSELALGGRDKKIQANLDRADELMRRVADKTLTLKDPVPL
ncbi:uncharacterized protein EDB93DRAFT_1251463 [Suillus bovinus]|uniref:uncharacterized protein n=1 Tax=Suillus bovinus TaxID=48563 RepID=UPI001B8725E5|nr:uncharacterized protein EDB93DRAFT_1251463 [Suillus bovinus]KAG2145363.1 hypothetical protein EDB93DRAFT_1251463 [Suillus bovinus]